MARKSKSETDYTIPTLHNYNGDLSKRWFINFYVKDQRTGEFVRKRITSINNGNTYRERMDEARKALKEIKELLKAGYTIQSPELSEQDTFEININAISFLDAIDFAINKKKLTVSRKTIWDYNSFKNTVEDFLKKKKLSYIPFKKVTLQLLYDFFDWLKEEKGLENKTYNNYHTNMSAIYNVFVNRQLIRDNPCRSIKKLKVEKGGKHKPFTQEQLQKIKAEILKRGDQQLFLFVNCIYYCFIRPHRELRFLQVKHLHEKTIFIPAELSKTGKGEHVIIPPGLEKLLQEYKIRSYPPDYYIFSREQKPGLKPVGKEYFYDRHKEILKAVGLQGQNYDIYGYKHTGNIHLFQAGADIKAIQKQNRHESIEMTDNYLKDLGLITNDEVFNKFPEF